MKKRQELAQAEGSATDKKGSKKGKSVRTASKSVSPSRSSIGTSRTNSIDFSNKLITKSIHSGHHGHHHEEGAGFTDQERICMDTTLTIKPITNFSQLAGNYYVYLIALLGTLSPESVWHFF
jgi:hypothetical protein